MPTQRPRRSKKRNNLADILRNIHPLTHPLKKVLKKLLSFKIHKRPEIAFIIIIILTILIFSCLYSNLLKGILSGAPRPSEETVTESPSPETVTEEETGLTQEEETTEIKLDIEKKKQDILQTLQYRAANGEPVFSLLIESPPQIDGNLDEWMEELVPAILETHPISQPTYLPENYTNPSDLSGTFMVAYDEERLYLAIRVIDDVFSQPFQGSDLFKGDSIIISLDTDLQGDFYERANNLDDYRVGLSPGDFSSLSPEAYIWVPQETRGDEISVASSQTSNGYIIEAAIPWWNFQNFEVEDGKAIGFDISINDKDFLEERELAISSSPSYLENDPTSFGTLVLLDTTKISGD
ncbi:hypothetical protein HKBW3S03_01094 [Candidatus Hakubella thermalkaliphila]|uniref:Carbohydrate-binding domain-containing protein n=1 Tax=Candidatus Hakubella thermalkaliphila TaxID=2754717 RepID=A0A6V8NH12_9ACTN|nr:hypothetical protein HKBW3S03_01094 [Candidatus Hakubella thermalkaliphila]